VIVRMSKVEIVGPKNLILAVLAVIREQGVFHIDPDYRRVSEDGREATLAALTPDELVISERQLLEDLGGKIDELTACLPKVPVRESYVSPQAIVGSVSVIVEKHRSFCRGLSRRKEAMRKELAELDRHKGLLETLEELFAGIGDTAGLDFIGVALTEPGAAEHISELLTGPTFGRFEIFPATTGDGSMIALLAVQKGFAGRIKQMLSDERIPELPIPQPFENLTFAGKIRYSRKRVADLSAGITAIDAELEKFARRWLVIYRRVRKWLYGRLALLKTTATVYETKLCFLINGWIPTADVPRLSKRLAERFGGRVVVEEQEIREADLERIPVAIRNPAYFRPFEIFTRLLPLPHYTSFDPTIFIGIFFPIFFGMILGDAGYGLFLLGVSIIVMKAFRGREVIRNAAVVLLICSVYSVSFGLLYGEFFGELGHMFLGLQPIWMSRFTAVIPMLYFAVSVGIFHVVLGLFLGFLSAVHRKVFRAAIFKLANILVILCLVAFFMVRFIHVTPQFDRIIVITLAAIIPLLFICGGVLAPLELLKSLGNVISYARIMAIGLASVLLASVANKLAGMTGDILTGILVAGLFHAVNILLGVFAPTIQSLRLHYVEFFSKFLEHGGRKFEPFK
jgi:V/A-type H+-transporting ATPase subunit I